MKIIFFGLGSIGQRHARLLRKNFNHDLFAYRSNRQNEPNKVGIKEIYSWKEVKELSPDVAFITNPTSLHIKTAIKCAELGINLFIEKPIDCSTDRLDKLVSLVRKNRLTTYVAYCMRFHPVIKWLHEYLDDKKSMHAKVVCSSYLPDWRPGRDYRNIYSAESKKGGGAILELSHEIDYSRYLFGDILEMQGSYGKVSDLEINSEDYADIAMKCRKGAVNAHLDFFSKDLERTIKIDFQNSDYIRADLIRNTLSINKNGSERRYKYKLKKDDIYLRQLEYFFKNFKKRKMMNNLIDASRVFKRIVTFKNEK